MPTNTTNTTNIVKFHNDVNKVAFTGFTKRELSVFYSLAKIMDDKQDQEIFISFAELRRVMNMPFENSHVFVQTLSSTVNKLLSIHATIQKENGNILSFVPFITFEIMPAKKMMRVRVNPEYTYLFNMLTKNFTYFELKDFNQLRTKYSQRLYSLLKQYRNTGRLYISVEDFNRLLDIPASYDARKIGARIINPSMKELKNSFINLETKKIRKGRFIAAYEFTFIPEKNLNTSVKSVEEGEKTEKIFCPHCGREMVRRINKETGAEFYGHKYYKKNECRVTYSTLEELEKDRATIEKEKAQAEQKTNDAERAWESVLKKQQSLFDTLKK